MIKSQLIDYNVTCVIMGGGAGTRLMPLTGQRAKPAVPLAGKFRLIDIPISNCINSGLTHIYILTQFNSTPLHRHVNASYHFDRFSRGYVEILAAQQTPTFTHDYSWYQGTADAVRKNLRRFRESGAEQILILSGDQIYQMDFRDVLRTHYGQNGDKADVTIGSVLMPREPCRELGILRADRSGKVQAFVEKPGDRDELFDDLEAAPELLAEFGVESDEPLYMANMGIYVFDVDVLTEALDNDKTDFGREVLPSLLERYEVRAHGFQGYWEDIGTLRSFHQANIELANTVPHFNFYDENWPVYTRARLLPASKLGNVAVNEALIAEGCLIGHSFIERSLIGVRSIIGDCCTIRNTYMMGVDAYEDDADRQADRDRGIPPIGIGDSSTVINAIVDKDARIGRNVSLLNEPGHVDFDDGVVKICDGITVVPRGGIVPDGYSI